MSTIDKIANFIVQNKDLTNFGVGCLCSSAFGTAIGTTLVLVSAMSGALLTSGTILLPVGIALLVMNSPNAAGRATVVQKPLNPIELFDRGYKLRYYSYTRGILYTTCCSCIYIRIKLSESQLAGYGVR